MNTVRTWRLLLGVVLVGCAASGPVLSEEEAVSDTCREASAREEADTCLALLCDEEVCGFFRCEDVAEGVTTSEGASVASGGVVKTWANPSAVSLYPPGYNPHLRNWGSPLRLPGEQGAVFIIPWGNHHHHRHLLPSQKQLIEEANARLNRPHEKHHLFPQEFKAWFERQGIDIHQWTMLIETDVHKHIHRGASGGPWNAAWRKFIREKRADKQVPQEEIWKHAWELCVRFGLMAPLQPYYGRTNLPPPIGF